MGVLQNFQKFRVRVWKCYRTSSSSGYCGTGMQNSHKFWADTKHDVPVPRVLWHRSNRTHRSSGYDYKRLPEFPEVPGTGMKVLKNFQDFRVLWHGHTEHPELPGRHKHAVPVPRVFVAPAYRTSRSSGYGYECPTEGSEVLCRVIPGVIPRVWFCVCPTDRTKIESSGAGMNVVHNSQTFRARVGLYRTHRSPGYG